MSDPIRYRETKYGFEWGPWYVFRAVHDEKLGYVVGLKTKGEIVYVRASPKGRRISVEGPEKVAGDWTPREL